MRHHPLDVKLLKDRSCKLWQFPAPDQKFVHGRKFSEVDMLDRHEAWLLKSVTMFKSPNQASRSALEGGVVGLGARRIEVWPELKELVLQLSRIALLDEVQSYIVVSRYVERNNMPHEFKFENLPHRVLLHYYLERQCLLKCIRQIIVHSCGFDSSAKISKGAKLFSDDWGKCCFVSWRTFFLQSFWICSMLLMLISFLLIYNGWP